MDNGQLAMNNVNLPASWRIGLMNLSFLVSCFDWGDPSLGLSWREVVASLSDLITMNDLFFWAALDGFSIYKKDCVDN